jgi:ubiquitin carboxyl-terminal hydrolase 5/13
MVLTLFSCYMASVMQTLFTLPIFRDRYYSELALTHFQTCDNALPASCLECQMLKLADGLISGRYSHRAKLPPLSSTDFDASQEPPKFQEGIRPSQFKALIGKGHEEFSTMRQQDSEEFLQHLLTRLRTEAKRQGRSEAMEATNIVRFGMEQRLQCSECRRVGYRSESVDLASLPVSAVEKGVDENGKRMFEEVGLEECIESLCATEELSDYSCSSCNKKVRAEK